MIDGKEIKKIGLWKFALLYPELTLTFTAAGFLLDQNGVRWTDGETAYIVLLFGWLLALPVALLVSPIVRFLSFKDYGLLAAGVVGAVAVTLVEAHEGNIPEAIACVVAGAIQIWTPRKV